MTKWLGKLAWPRRTRMQAIHPPWRPGQYVTYVLDRDDGSWSALALRIVGQDKDGSWSLEGDFKTPGGECTMLFRSDPDAPEDAMDPVPVRRNSLRRFSSVSDDMESMVADPLMAVPLAMNLLMVRRWPAAAESLARGAARPVQYPCGIDSAHRLVTPGPGYEKHHDLSPRVLLTGVACLSIDGSKNPMTVTSFGLADAAAEPPRSYDDFVDLSHLRRVEHEGFTLTYPATWFLRRDPEQNDGRLRTSGHSTQVGGLSCSLRYSVRICRGDRDRVREEYDAARMRLSHLPGLSWREAEPLRLPGRAWGAVLDYVQPETDGVAYTAGFIIDDGSRFALVSAFGGIAKASPRRHETLAAYERVFRTSLESFRFV